MSTANWLPVEGEGFTRVEIDHTGSSPTSAFAKFVALAAAIRKPGAWDLEDKRWGDQRDFADGVWFRGARDASYPPKPTSWWRGPAGRTGELYNETTLFHDFRLRLARETAESERTSTLDTLSLMRHYEVPCRLLDWSLSPLAALAFATRGMENQPPPSSVSVWILNARALNVATTWSRYLAAPLQPHDLLPNSVVYTDRNIWVHARVEQAQARSLTHLARLLRGRSMSDVGLSSDILLEWMEGLALEPDPGTPGSNPLREALVNARTPDEIIAAIALANNKPADRQASQRDALWRLLTPCAVQPPWTNPRILAQRGMFTAHGGRPVQENERERLTKAGAYPLPRAVHLDYLARRCAVPGLLMRRVDLTPNAASDCAATLRSLDLAYEDLLPELEHQVESILARAGGHKVLDQDKT